MKTSHLCLCTLLLAGAVRAADVSPSYPRDLTKADVERWMTELSNWGRWGKDDQAGTINLITPEKRRQAAALVRDGVSVSMSLNADLPKETAEVPPPAPSTPPPAAVAPATGAAPGAAAAPGGRRGPPRAAWQHNMMSNGLGRQEGYVVDSYTVSFHGNTTTHLDALSHFIYNGHIFNGFPGDVITAWGATKNDVMPFKDGILTRGVLIDMPAMKGVKYLGDDEAVFPEDILAWEKKTGIHISSGDAVFLRTGRWVRVAEKGPLNLNVATPGFYASCAKFFHERGIAILGSDVVQDVRPSRVTGVNQPLHQILLVSTGTPLIDNCDLEALSAAAAQRNRYEFMFAIAPLRVPGGTGSPLNPIATF
jgi:kynurenine formamidase